MLALIYVSRVVPSRQPIDGLFRAILAVARTRNKEHNITGLLGYAGGYFVQLLEGERSAVLKLYASISRDERHTDVTILSSTKITQRTHGEWVMGGALLSTASADMMRQLLQIRDAGVLRGGASANEYFRHLLAPMRISETDKEAKFARSVRHIAICATSLVWLNTFFAYLRDLLEIKIESLIASDPSSSSPNYPVDYCDIEHPQFGPIRITSFYAEMMESPLAVPLLHQTDYLLGLFARGAIETKLNFASKLFQHPSIIESRPKSVLVTQDDDNSLKNLVTMYVTKSKLPAPTFLAATVEPQDIWDNIVAWLKANPIAPIVTDANIDFDVTAPYMAVAEPIAVTVAPVSVPVPSLTPTAAVLPKAALAAVATTTKSTPILPPVSEQPAAAQKTSEGIASKPVSKPTATPITPRLAAPIPGASITIVEHLELDRIFSAITTMPGFRFAAVADTASAIRTGVRAFKMATPDDHASFATALPLLQEWLTLGVTEFPDNPKNKAIHSLAINDTHFCRFAYKLGTDGNYALIFELEREYSNIAWTTLLVDEIRADLKQG
jgi:Sensors of blue-light using FAD